MLRKSVSLFVFILRCVWRVDGSVFMCSVHVFSCAIITDNTSWTLLQRDDEEYQMLCFCPIRDAYPETMSQWFYHENSGEPLIIFTPVCLSLSFYLSVRAGILKMLLQFCSDVDGWSSVILITTETVSWCFREVTSCLSLKCHHYPQTHTSVFSSDGSRAVNCVKEGNDVRCCVEVNEEWVKSQHASVHVLWTPTGQWQWQEVTYWRNWLVLCI